MPSRIERLLSPSLLYYESESPISPLEQQTLSANVRRTGPEKRRYGFFAEFTTKQIICGQGF